MDPVHLGELAALARQHMDPMAWDYYAGGARDEITLGENRAAWDRLRIHYRVLRGVGSRSTACTVLGESLSMPVLVAPSAFHRLAHVEGEAATARGAARAGTAMVLSTLSTVEMETVCAQGAPVWFQLYVYKDRSLTRDLVARAEAAGCTALVLTVDAALIGTRERDVRNRFHLPPDLQCRNLVGAGFEAIPEAEGGSGLAAYVAEWLEGDLTWADLDWLVSITRLPVLVKGIVRADDARLARGCGAAGVVVSNHGGRQLDTAPPTAEVLPRVAEAVGDDLTVLVDGGIRRGTDVIKALALGAHAVMLGRPVLWGLAWRGEDGVAWALETLRAELDEAMALSGCASLEEVGADLLTGGS